MPETPRNIGPSIASSSALLPDEETLKGSETVEQIKELIKKILLETPSDKGTELATRLQNVTDELRYKSFGSAINPKRFLFSRYVSGVSFKITQARTELLEEMNQLIAQNKVALQQQEKEALIQTTVQKLTDQISAFSNSKPENLEQFLEEFQKESSQSFQYCLGNAVCLESEAARSSETTLLSSNGNAIKIADLIDESSDIRTSEKIADQLKILAPDNSPEALAFMQTLYRRDIENAVLKAPYIAPVVDANGTESLLRHSGTLLKRKIQQITQNKFRVNSETLFSLNVGGSTVSTKLVTFSFKATFQPHAPRQPIFIPAFLKLNSLSPASDPKLNEQAIRDLLE